MGTSKMGSSGESVRLPQVVPGSIPGPSVICGLSLMLVPKIRRLNRLVNKSIHSIIRFVISLHIMKHHDSCTPRFNLFLAPDFKV